MSMPTSLGTAARALYLQSASVRARTDLARHGAETSTGTASNLSRHLAGDTGPVALLDLRLARIASNSNAISLHSAEFDLAQNSLSRIGSAGQRLFEHVTTAYHSEMQPAVLDKIGIASIAALDDMLGALSVKYAGKAIFSGSRPDQLPFPSGQTVLGAIQATLPPGLTARELLDHLDLAFSPLTGFVPGSLYSGGAKIPATAMAAGQPGPALPLAQEPELLQLLKLAVVGSFLGSSLSISDMPQKQQLAEALLARAPGALEDLVHLQARTGFSQEALKKLTDRLKAERQVLETARLDLAKVDPLEAAARLESSRTELESIYHVISRVSKISLLGFIR